MIFRNGVVMGAEICQYGSVCVCVWKITHTGTKCPTNSSDLVQLYNLNPASQVHPTHYFAVNLYKLLLLANSQPAIYVSRPPRSITAAVTTS